MDLNELLSSAVEGVPGAVAISLLGVDGVAVETLNGAKSLPQNGSHAPAEATEAWEIELADLMLAARRSAQSLAWGDLSTVNLETEQLAFLAQMINPEYFLLLVLEKDANMGRARFELRRVGAALAQNL